MAYPEVIDVSRDNQAANTLHTISLPSHAVGDYIIIFMAIDYNRTWTIPDPWVKLSESNNDGELVVVGATVTSAPMTNPQMEISSSEPLAYQAYSIRGHSDYVVAAAPATGSSNAPNPPLLTDANLDGYDVLWLAACSNDYNRTVTAYPLGYTDGINDLYNSTAGCGVGSARKLTRGYVSEDPGTFSISSSDTWGTATVAIRGTASPPSTVIDAGTPAGSCFNFSNTGSTTYLTVRNGTFGTMQSGHPFVGQYHPAYYVVQRGCALFDVDSFVGKTILGARLKTKCTYESGTAEAHIVAWIGAGFPNDGSDFNDFGDESFGYVVTTSVVVDGDVIIDLNAAGVSYIQGILNAGAANYLTLGFRLDDDIDAVYTADAALDLSASVMQLEIWYEPYAEGGSEANITIGSEGAGQKQAISLGVEKEFGGDPGSLPVTSGLVLHLDADAITGLNDGDPISQWDDLSPSGYHAIQTVPDCRPIYTTDGFAGRGGVYFNFEEGQFLDCGNVLGFSLNDSFTMFAVAHPGGPILARCELVLPGGYPRGLLPLYGFYNGDDGEIGYPFLFGDVTSNAIYVDNLAENVDDDQHLFMRSYNGSGVANGVVGRVDGVTLDPSVVMDNALPYTYVTPLLVGALGSFLEAYDAFGGVIAEIVVFNRVLTENERDAVEQYLTTKWIPQTIITSDSFVEVTATGAGVRSEMAFYIGQTTRYTKNIAGSIDQTTRSVSSIAETEGQSTRYLSSLANFNGQTIRLLQGLAGSIGQTARYLEVSATTVGQTLRKLFNLVSTQGQGYRQVLKTDSKVGQTTRNIYAAANTTNQTTRNTKSAAVLTGQTTRSVTGLSTFMGQTTRRVVELAGSIGQTARNLLSSAGTAGQTTRDVQALAGEERQTTRQVVAAVGSEGQTTRTVLSLSGFIGQATRYLKSLAGSVGQTTRNTRGGASTEGQTFREVLKATSSVGQTTRQVSKAGEFIGQATRYLKFAGGIAAQATRLLVRGAGASGQTTRDVRSAAGSEGQTTRNVCGIAGVVGQTARNVLSAAGYIAQTTRNVIAQYTASVIAQLTRYVRKADTAEGQTTRQVTKAAGTEGQTTRIVDAIAGIIGQAIRYVLKADSVAGQTTRQIESVAGSEGQTTRGVRSAAGSTGQTTRQVRSLAEVVGQTARDVRAAAGFIAQTTRNLTTEIIASFVAQVTRYVKRASSAEGQATRQVTSRADSEGQTTRQVKSAAGTAGQTSRLLSSIAAAIAQTMRRLGVSADTDAQTTRQVTSGASSAGQTTRRVFSVTALAAQTMRRLAVPAEFIAQTTRTVFDYVIASFTGQTTRTVLKGASVRGQTSRLVKALVQRVAQTTRRVFNFTGYSRRPFKATISGEDRAKREAVYRSVTVESKEVKVSKPDLEAESEGITTKVR